MADSSWDNSGLPEPTRGRGLGTKLALGCGAGVLLILLTCLGFTGYGLHKGAQAADRVWQQVATSVRQLRTDEGARALYRENPGLAESYPTEAAFLEAAATWRPKLAGVPEQRPDLKELFREGKGLAVDVRSRNGQEHLKLRYTVPSGAILRLETQEGRLTDLRVD